MVCLVCRSGVLGIGVWYGVVVSYALDAWLYFYIYFFGLFRFPFVLFICLLVYPVGSLLWIINSRSVSQLSVSLVGTMSTYLLWCCVT